MESLRRTRIARVYADDVRCCYPLVRLFSIWIAAPPSICSANQLQLEMDRYYEDLSTLKSTLADDDLQVTIDAANLDRGGVRRLLSRITRRPVRR